jgi:hypothetical protein
LIILFYFKDFDANTPCVNRFISIIENFTLFSGNETLCLKKLMQTAISGFKNETLPESE